MEMIQGNNKTECFFQKSLLNLVLQAAKIMRTFFYGAPAEIMQIYTTLGYGGLSLVLGLRQLLLLPKLP